MLFVFAVVMSVVTILTVILFRKTKKFETINYEDKLSLKEEMKLLVENKNYIYVAVASSCNINFFLTFSTIVGQILFYFDFNVETTAYTGLVYEVSGIPGAVAVAIFLIKTKKYIFASHLINIGTLICIFLFTLVIYFHNTPALYCVMMLMGVINLSIFSVSYEFAVEVAHPVSEAMSSGLINLLAMA